MQKNNSQRNNFQDKFADAEFDKGYKAGSKPNRQRRRQNRKPSDKIGVVAIGTGSHDNDASWYTPNNQMVSDVASIQQVAKPGYPINLYEKNSASSAQYVPGIMTYYYVPTFGVSNDGDSALNVAATALYTKLRLRTNVASNYDKNDAMLFVIAGGQLLAYYSYLIKIYGCIQDWSMTSTYQPRPIVESMGVNYDNLVTQLADFRAWINQFAYSLQSLPIPKVLYYTTRQIFMNESIYKDANSDKAQLSHFVPLGFYCYEEGTVASVNGGQMVFKSLPGFTNGAQNSQGGTMTLTDLIEYGNMLLNPVLGSQDMSQYIAGDILKAYTSANLYTVSPIAETFTVKPVYVPEVLEQMENMFIYPGWHAVASLTQKTIINNSYLSSNLVLLAGTDAQPTTTSTDDKYNAAFSATLGKQTSLILNRHEADFPQDRVMTMTRLSGVYPQYQTSDDGWLGPNGKTYKAGYIPYTCGTEIILDAQIRYYQETTSVGTQQTFKSYFKTFRWALSASSYTLYPMLVQDSVLSSFDWHPRVVTLIYTPSSGSYPDSITSMNGGTWDLDNYTTISVDVLDNLNRVALLGEFASQFDNIQSN